MSFNDNDNSFGRSFPMLGLLIFATGFGMLLVAWKFSLLFREWPRPALLTFVAVGVLFLLGGVKQLVVASLPTQGENRNIPSSRHGRRFTKPGLVYLGMMAVFFIASLLGRSNMLMLVYSLMAGPFVVNGWVTYSMLKRTEIRRRLPDRAMAGESFSVAVVLENRKSFLSMWLIGVVDQITGNQHRLSAGLLFARVPTRSQRSGRYQVRLMQRGKYTFGPLYATTSFPMGLVERGLRFDATDEIVIYPRLGKLSRSWKQEQHSAAETTDREDSRAGAFDDEFHHIREYRWGDNPRAIHWRTSARHNELMVCQYHQNRDQDMAVLLDLWTPERPGVADLERVELAVSFAATVCVEYMHESRDSNLFLAVSGEESSVWEGQSSPANVVSLLEKLAMVKSSVRADRGELIEGSLAHRLAISRTVLITTRPGDWQETTEKVAAASSRSAIKARRDIRTIVAGKDELEKYFYFVD